MKIVLQSWLVIAIVVTGLSWLLYGVVQQDIRHAADDPQIQWAEDTATKLADGQSVQRVVPVEKVDIAKSLAPYIIVFDSAGKPLASSAQLDGHTPTIPLGVFDEVRHKGEDRITWQPQPGVRSAIVVTQVKGPNASFVLVGRSLGEVEKREDDIMHIVLLGWIGMLLVTLLASMVIFRNPQRS
ncbi:MAG: hypothetical protein JO125_12170 [Chloroflexi bacterium]|nr:hypothetical protein [Ktedonobacteraceae bacterium]MBV8822393.1 hypothetical protein [Ktedonobacteraceae bacterium]MBV9020524.1 hypothetical protein [Ktedonobacteraceae bacterium]MBV9708152.1 hypothetical protein [Chloroflexota bacterium]